MEEIQIQVEEEPITIAGGAVNSVNGQTGDVVLTAQDVGALPDSTVIPSKTSDLENDSDYQTGDEVNQAIGLETTARENADIGLQGQIDALSAASDVTDIVGTYADLQAYDTSKLKDNDIIKVLQDENQNDETTYYRWVKATSSFTLIGEEGPYYTKAAADQKFQDKLTAGSNITIDANNEISATDTTYSNFTGTDGSDPGTAGLVPAPATTDAGKYLKADGTWETVSAGPTVVQTTGTSQTDVMSQVAASNLVYPTGHETSKDRIEMGKNADAHANDTIAIGYNAAAYNNYSIGIGRDTYGLSGIAIGYKAATQNDSLAVGREATATKNSSVAIGSYSKATGRINELSIGSGVSGTTPVTRYIANVTDPQYAQDAATKNYTDNLVINYSAINGSAAPTTATEAKYVGQLYYDTTNDDMYYCSAITAQGTTPETYEYTWNTIGGGGSGIPTTTTFWGASYDAVNDKVTGSINLGGNVIHSGSLTPSAVASDRYFAFSGSNQPIIKGSNLTLTGASPSSSNEQTVLQIKGTTAGQRIELRGATAAQTLRISGVTDPTAAQDAATKNYVDTRVLTNAGAPTTSTVGVVGQLLEDTTNGKLYQCTDATNPYVWTEVGSGGGGGGSGIPTDATIFGATYDSVNNKVDGPVTINDGNGGSVTIGQTNSSTSNNSGALVTTGNALQVKAKNQLKIDVGTGGATTFYSGGSIGLPASMGTYNARIFNLKAEPVAMNDAASAIYVASYFPVGTVIMSTSATAPDIGAQVFGMTWTQIGSQTIGSKTVYYYERTA